MDDHTDGHYITLFAEQLTRTFEVLVFMTLSWGLVGQWDMTKGCSTFNTKLVFNHFEHCLDVSPGNVTRPRTAVR